MTDTAVLPKVSIVVRTHARPAVLREALASLGAQTYRPFEVIVVEDGAPHAEAVVSEFREVLDIHYCPTVRHVGRSAAGNIGLAKARGEWLGFLDDDDQLLPQHIATLVQAGLQRQAKVVYGLAREVPTTVLRITDGEFVYREGRAFVRYSPPFSRLTLWQSNFLPIQSVLFHRSLYETHGGFDEDIDQLEDWLLWVRFSLSERFEMVDIVTSSYRVPARHQEITHRQSQLAFAYEAAIARQRDMQARLSPSEIVELFEAEFLRAPLRYLLRSRGRRFLYRLPRVHACVRRLLTLVGKILPR